MERRNFFNWIGKVALVVGSGYLLGQSKELDYELPDQSYPLKPGNPRIRMNGRACHDYRLMSGDRSMILDRDIFQG
jgi:hypothetical protein